MRFRDYGDVVSYGFDEEVPVHVKAEMEAIYGYDGNYMSELAKDMKAAKNAVLQEQEQCRILDIIALLKSKRLH